MAASIRATSSCGVSPSTYREPSPRTAVATMRGSEAWWASAIAVENASMARAWSLWSRYARPRASWNAASRCAAGPIWWAARSSSEIASSYAHCWRACSEAAIVHAIVVRGSSEGASAWSAW